MNQDYRTGQRWSKAHDETLKSFMINKSDESNCFKIIAGALGRTDIQCKNRWEYVILPGITKGPWTDEEDRIIIDSVKNGITKWSEIAKKIKGRIGKQCRERWANHLDPALKKSEWSIDEDNLLTSLQIKFGNSWTKIANLIPGRSENDVKNRWNSADRKKRFKSSEIKSPGNNKSIKNLKCENDSSIQLANTYLKCIKSCRKLDETHRKSECFEDLNFN